MVQRTPGRKAYRTANGKSIDLDLLIQRNELTPAVGNARVNARGDELGQGGKIIRKREEVLKDYYNSSPSVPDEKANPRKSEAEETTVSEPKKETKKTQPKVEPKPVTLTAKEKKELEELDDGWVEDNEGNLVQKGNK